MRWLEPHARPKRQIAIRAEPNTHASLSRATRRTCTKRRGHCSSNRCAFHRAPPFDDDPLAPAACPSIRQPRVANSSLAAPSGCVVERQGRRRIDFALRTVRSRTTVERPRFASAQQYPRRSVLHGGAAASVDMSLPAARFPGRCSDWQRLSNPRRASITLRRHIERRGM
jgi:hypothetical protein